MYTDISTEAKATIGLLLCSIPNGQQQLSQPHLENISKILVLCTRLRDQDMNVAFAKVFNIYKESSRNDMIIYYAALVSEDFADTVFCMCCETAMAQGRWNDAFAEPLATIGLALQLSTDDVKNIIRTYIVRNRWNVQIESA
ncbi:MAG: hypothetical protein C4330_12355 [Chitinophagaceae bacterium]